MSFNPSIQKKDALPINRYNFKSFVVTILFPLACIILIHLIGYSSFVLLQRIMLNSHPSYEFFVYLPVDSITYNEGVTSFFKAVYMSHGWGEIMLPLVLVMVTGRKSFAIWIKCSIFCYLISFALFLIFPVVNYLHEPWFTGPDSIVDKPTNYQYSVGNLGNIPSFHHLVALLPIVCMLYVKLDQKKVNKIPYFISLFLMTVYYCLIFASTVIIKQHYFADGPITWLFIAIIFGFFTLVYRSKNGQRINLTLLKMDYYVNDNYQAHKRKSVTLLVVIAVVIFIAVIGETVLSALVVDTLDSIK